MVAEHAALADVRRHGNGADVEGHAVNFGPPGSRSASGGRAAATVDAGTRAPAAKAQQVQGTAQLQLQERRNSLPTGGAAATKCTATLAAGVEHILSTSS